MSIFTIQDEIRRDVDQSNTRVWLEIDSRRAWRDLALDWLGIALAIVLLSKMQAWWMFILVAVWIGLRQYALFILGHDAMHGSLHPNHKLNDTISKWFIHGPMFMGFEDGKRNHLEHHKLLGSKEDPDRYLHVLTNKASIFQFLLYCAGLATFVKTVIKVTPFGKLKSNAQSGEQSISATTVLLQYMGDRIPVFFAQFIILAAFWLLGLPLWSYLVVWVAPIFFGVFVPDEIRAFCEHAVLSFQDDEMDVHRLVTYRPSLLEGAYFSPHHMNYHAEHHLWPRVPHYNLPKVYEGIKHRPEINVRPGYLGFLRQVLIFLRQKDKAQGSQTTT